ncbi:hypothetical protein QWY82_04945 [Simiduia curdlanivorans]|uniref:DUF4136 domain-containing protein n=1 Tax=Simiduia curdlanivorans TaxID=1492769 RepID=A0ABV8V3W6_9GAMM|nr:hypothetical protein [Simiduia curdlanivorans]MDN3638155.1 hypothetical protein [Simiduia curdlanivorans]
MTRFIALIAMLLLAACASEPEKDQTASKEKVDLAAFSVVAVTDPMFKPARGDTVSWVSDVIFAGSKEETPQDEATVALIQADIEQSLTGKGYTLGHGVGVDYRVLALVQVGTEELAKDMRELFRLYPSLGHDSQLNKGMLIVAVARPGSVQALWRGAIRVFVDEDQVLTQEQQKERLALAVKKVMASMPKAL